MLFSCGSYHMRGHLLQCVAVFVAMCCSVCCSVLQHVAVREGGIWVSRGRFHSPFVRGMWDCLMHCVVVYCSVLQSRKWDHKVVCCNVLQCAACVAVCCNVTLWCSVCHMSQPRLGLQIPDTEGEYFCHTGFVVVCCSLLQCAAACCSQLELDSALVEIGYNCSVAVCCSIAVVATCCHNSAGRQAEYPLP